MRCIITKFILSNHNLYIYAQVCIVEYTISILHPKHRPDQILRKIVRGSFVTLFRHLPYNQGKPRKTLIGTVKRENLVMVTNPLVDIWD